MRTNPFDYELTFLLSWRGDDNLHMEPFVSVGLTLITTLVGAFVGAFASSRFGYQQRAFAEEDKRRHDIAESTLPPLLELRRLLRHAQELRSNKAWAVATEAAYEALDDARHLMPPSLRHLKRSVRASVGEAMGGVAMADLDPRMLEYELAPFDYRWTSYAEEYLDGVIETVRRWRDASRSRAPKVSMRNFDDWLKISGRYEPGI